MPNLSSRPPQLSQLLSEATSVDTILRFIMDWLVDLNDETGSLSARIHTLEKLSTGTLTRLGHVEIGVVDLGTQMAQMTASYADLSVNQATMATGLQALNKDNVAMQAQINSLQVGLEQVGDLSLRLDAVETALVNIMARLPPIPGPATGLALKIQQQQKQGANIAMASTTLSVDVANEEVAVSWEDDKGEATTDIPPGATIVLASSNPSVATVGAAVPSATGVTAPLSFIAAGSASLTATATAADGTAVPGFAVASSDLVITPGPAASLLVSVDQAAPLPAP